MAGLAVSKTGTKNTTGISFLEELRRYAEVLGKYWPLILGIGLFFGWLLSFPFQGPLFWALTQKEGLSPLPLASLLLTGHIIGLILAGISGFFFHSCLRWFSLGGALCFILSLFMTRAPIESYGPVLALLGFFAGFAIISWGNSFVSGVPSFQRGRTFILAAVIANLILYLINWASSRTETDLLIDIISILTLAIPVFLILWRRTHPIIKVLPDAGWSEQIKPQAVWPYLPFIFVIYAVGGLMYSVVGSLSSPPTDLLSFYALIPYILLLFLAGTFSDIFGRRINAIAGSIMVGIGFMFVGLFQGDVQFIMIQTFMVGGYAFLDAFTWVTAADVSTHRRSSIHYSIILGTNILAILVGVLLGGRIGELVTGAEILTVSIAGIFCFISLALVFRLRETLRLSADITPPRAQASLEVFSKKSEFTPREMEIVKLLIEGNSTPEILEKLFVTPNTLKTHVRNIYRKAGTRNRWEFTMRVLKEINPPGK